MAENANLGTIIVAEDSTPNRKILVHLLEKMGFTVIACENGKAAWEKLNDPKIPAVLAVISDIMMPGMDGLELLKSIRNSEKYKAIPVLLITAVSEKEYILQAKELNVNGYVLKPVTFQRVSSKLKELFPNLSYPKIAA